MSESYIGEIKLFAAGFAPVGWLLCDGSLAPISAFDALFTLIGTAYGGDGTHTFGLPDLRGRFPVHRSAAIPLGAQGGAETVTLAAGQLAGHSHAFNATKALADQPTPGGNVPGQATTITLYVEDTPAAALSPAAVAPAPGGGQPHENMHPFQVVNYIICAEGIFPPRS